MARRPVLRRQLQPPPEWAGMLAGYTPPNVDVGGKVTFEQLHGRHLLCGVDADPSTGGPASFLFALGGKTFAVLEDESDGYRSSLQDILCVASRVRTVFPPVWVWVSSHPDSYRDTLLFKVDSTGEVVLEIGTNEADDYYPSFVCDWRPENLPANAHLKSGGG